MITVTSRHYCDFRGHLAYGKKRRTTRRLSTRRRETSRHRLLVEEVAVPQVHIPHQAYPPSQSPTETGPKLPRRAPAKRAAADTHAQSPSNPPKRSLLLGARYGSSYTRRTPSDSGNTRNPSPSAPATAASRQMTSRPSSNPRPRPSVRSPNTPGRRPLLGR